MNKITPHIQFTMSFREILFSIYIIILFRNLGLATGIAAAGSGLGQLIMAPVIHVVDEQLGLSYTMIVLAGSVALAIFFAFIYKKPGRKVLKAPYEGRSDLACFHEDVKVVKISIKSEEDLSQLSEAGSTLVLVQESSDIGCALTLIKSYGKIFTSPAMAVLLGKSSIKRKKRFTMNLKSSMKTKLPKSYLNVSSLFFL